MNETESGSRSDHTTSSAEENSTRSFTTDAPTRHKRPTKSKRSLLKPHAVVDRNTDTGSTFTVVTPSSTGVVTSILRKSTKYTKSTPTPNHENNVQPPPVDDPAALKTDTTATTTTTTATTSHVLPSTQEDRVVERSGKSRRARVRAQITDAVTTTRTIEVVTDTVSTIESSTNHHHQVMNSVEGYIPKSHLNEVVPTLIAGAHNDPEDNESPLIFNSLADLMEMAGTLPSLDPPPNNHQVAPHTMMETQLEFAVVDPTTHLQEQHDIFLGLTSLPSPQLEAVTLDGNSNMNDPVSLVRDDGHNDANNHRHEDNTGATDPQRTGPRKSIRERFSPENEDEYSRTSNESHLFESDGEDDDDDDDDDVLMDALKQHGRHRITKTDPTPRPPPRAFILFWNAISQWVTPAAVEYIYQLRHTGSAASSMTTNTPQHPPNMTYQQPNDIALSRCQGLMTVIQQQTSKCWKDYIYIKERVYNNGTSDNNNDTHHTTISLLRQAEQHVATLLRCLDYTHPTPKFNTIQIRALTCILLDLVMVGTILPINRVGDGHHHRHHADDPAGLVPSPCVTLGMTVAEYCTIVQSSILSFRTD